MSEDARISSMTDVEVLEYLQKLQLERSELDSRMVRALSRLHSLRDNAEFAHAKYVDDEVAAALSWGRRVASDWVATSVELTDRLPETVTALESGQVDMPKARAILEWTDALPVEQARQVAGDMHEWSVGRTPGAVRQKLSRELVKIDPKAAEARRQKKIARRSVSLMPLPDGMASLSIYDQAERLQAIFLLLDCVARQAKAAGDLRTLDALRADALAAFVMGPVGERVRVELRVTVPASVLAGVSDAPGWLHGYGPITRKAIWELAERYGFWRRIVTDPLTGTVVEVSRRQPPGSLREYVNTRTPTCVGVGCARPAESCETDHTRDHALGGATAEGNLGPTCRHHNLMKLEGGWRLEQPEPGWFVWTSPAGVRYEIPPEPVVEPTPDPPAVVVEPDDRPPPF